MMIIKDGNNSDYDGSVEDNSEDNMTVAMMTNLIVIRPRGPD